MATPAAALTTLTGLAFADSEFDGQFLRALDTIFVGGADIGECFMTARRITPGDKESWLAEWNATGDTVYAAAEKSLAAGQTVSAREGFLRAVTYYRSAGAFLFRPPLDPQLRRIVQATAGCISTRRRTERVDDRNGANPIREDDPGGLLRDPERLRSLPDGGDGRRV